MASLTSNPEGAVLFSSMIQMLLTETHIAAFVSRHSVRMAPIVIPQSQAICDIVKTPWLPYLLGSCLTLAHEPMEQLSRWEIRKVRLTLIGKMNIYWPLSTWQAFCMLSALYAWPHLIITRTLGNGYWYYLHFTDEKTEAWRATWWF